MDINRKRITEKFLQMIRIPSESLDEKQFADYCREFLEKEIGCEVYEDNAKENINGNQSNIIAKYYGNQMKKTIMFNAHLDTVKPGQNIEPIIENGIIKSKGDTILGADDKAGIASLFEALLYIKENDINVPDIDIVLTVAEEIGLLGAKNLDFSLLRAKECFALDSENIEGIFVRAPSQNSIEIIIEGIESHAGMLPEKGISAIKTAACAINLMPLGRIDSHTTANIGVINGGIATNIIPKKVVMKGEVRSHYEDRLQYYTDKIKHAVYEACSLNRITMPNGEVKTANFEIKIVKEYDSMHIKNNDKIIERISKVYEKLSIPYKLSTGGGGSDANIFNKNGITTVILGTGMSNVHTVDEFIKVDDMVTLTKILIELMQYE